MKAHWRVLWACSQGCVWGLFLPVSLKRSMFVLCQMHMPADVFRNLIIGAEHALRSAGTMYEAAGLCAHSISLACTVKDQAAEF